LVGPGGVGKTRLASEVCRRGGRAALFVDASTARDPDHLVRCALRDLRVSEALVDDPLSQVVRVAQEGGIEVVVLDNLEQVGSGDLPLLAALRSSSAPPAVVYTSRVALGAVGEEVLTLPPLASDDERVELFVHAAPRLGPLTVDPTADRSRIAALAEALDGLPLAIELAAGRLAVCDLEQLLDRVERAPGELLRDPARPADRASALWRSIGWSWDLLPEHARGVLTRLGAWSGPFDPAAAEEVIGEGAGVADALQLLLAWHLVRPEEERRLALYDSVRAYAAAELARAPDREEVLERHGAFYQARATLRRRSSRANVRALLDDLVELDAIVERGLAPGAPAAWLLRARAITDCLWFVDATRRSAREHALALDRAIRAGPVETLALSLLRDRMTLEVHFDRGASFRSGRELYALARELHDVSSQLQGLQSMLIEEVEREDWATVRRWSEEAVALALAHDQPGEAVQILTGPMNEEATLWGRWEEAVGRIARAEALAAGLRPYSWVMLHQDGALLDLARGAFDEAARRLREIAVLGRELSLNWNMLQLHAWLRALLAFRERPDLELLREAERELPPHASASYRALVGLLVAVGARIVDGRPVTVELPPGDTRDLALASLVRWAAQALDGAEDPAPSPPYRDPAATALRDAAAQVVDQALGRRPLDPVRITPSSPWGHVLLRLAEQAEAEALLRASAWEVAGDGSWFRAPSGDRVAVSALHARLLAALAAAAEGLDVDAMFAAGWGSERALPAARGNRVRVAVTTMRRAGLTILAWTRGRGWFLDGRVRRID
jgi:predicted ATPase